MVKLKSSGVDHAKGVVCFQDDFKNQHLESTWLRFIHFYPFLSLLTRLLHAPLRLRANTLL